MTRVFRLLNHFNNQINKHKIKAAAPHGRLPHTKHKLKSRPGPLSSSTVVTAPFIPSIAPQWDSRPVGEWRRCLSLSFTQPASLHLSQIHFTFSL